jgi:deoxycytidylate deaminase
MRGGQKVTPETIPQLIERHELLLKHAVAWEARALTTEHKRKALELIATIHAEISALLAKQEDEAKLRLVKA